MAFGDEASIVIVPKLEVAEHDAADSPNTAHASQHIEDQRLEGVTIELKTVLGPDVAVLYAHGMNPVAGAIPVSLKANGQRV